MSNHRLRLGIVGPGHVGAALGRALIAGGDQLVGVTPVPNDRLDELRAVLGEDVRQLDAPSLVASSDLVLLTVPGDALEATISSLSAAGAWKPGQLIVHTAPEFGVGILASAQAAGAIPLAIHPAMVFTGTSVDQSRIRGASFAVTAAAPVLPIAAAMIAGLGAETLFIDEAARPAYAEALDEIQARSEALVADAASRFEAIGISPVSPLLDATIVPAVASEIRNRARAEGVETLDEALEDGLDDLGFPLL
ncbi:NAD(P)-binding domain-containing protein [Humidisolicoccus flavus]|uniref:NAD(P)-binding domain-containing protein n=1 Tax=Humidisolicoccus flavus TaxID=3111414 RepID=UPI0032487F50